MEEITELQEAAEVKQQRKKGDRQKKGGEYEEESHGKARRLNVEESEQPGQRKNRRNGSETLLFFYVKRQTGRACLKKKNWPLDKGSKGRRKGMRHLALNNLPFKLSTRKYYS